MKKITRFVGLDVHAETIAVAVAESTGEVRSVGKIPNRIESIRKLVKRLGDADSIRCCYEAGVCGYVLYWQLTKLGIHCDVIAPSLIPIKAGDRVKTDRRDAEKLARCYRSGDLTPVPDEKHEALRDLLRAREAAKKDELRARHRLAKFLLRRDRRPPPGTKAWTQKHRRWLQTLQFDDVALAATFTDYSYEVDAQGQRVQRLDKALDSAIENAPESMRTLVDALQTLRGVAKLTATTIAVELGQVSRFDHDGKRAPEEGHHRGGLVLSKQTLRLSGAEETSGVAKRAGEGDCMEGTEPSSRALLAAGFQRKAPASSHNRGRARTARLRLGHRLPCRTRTGSAASHGVEAQRWSRAASSRGDRGNGESSTCSLRQGFGPDPRRLSEAAPDG
jgi:transposase